MNTVIPSFVQHRIRGFSMVDLLVGIAIGILGLLAVTKVLVDFNKSRNTTVQLMETQNNGAMAMYLLERDLAQAGYGLMPLLNCSTVQWYYTQQKSAFSPVPVAISDGGASSDVISVQYGKNSSGIPAVTITQNQPSYTAPYTVASITGFIVGDQIVTDSGSVCTLGQVTTVNNVSYTISRTYDAVTPGNTPYLPDPSNLPANAGTAWHSDSAATTQATVANLIAVNGAQLVNLGQFVGNSYSASNNALNVGSFPGYATTPLVDGVTMIKAQYGLDNNSDGIVDSWSPGYNIGAGTGFQVSNTNAKQVIAIRVGVVVRSPLFEKNVVAQPATLTVLPDTTGTLPGDSFTYTVPTAGNGDHYRYKVYYTVIPLKNVIWGR